MPEGLNLLGSLLVVFLVFPISVGVIVYRFTKWAQGG